MLQKEAQRAIEGCQEWDGTYLKPRLRVVWGGHIYIGPDKTGYKSDISNTV